MARRRNRRNSTGPDSLVGPVGAFFDSLKSGDIIEMAAISAMGMSKRFSGDYHPWKVGRRSHSKKYNVTSLRLHPVTGPKASARAAVKLYKRRDRVSAGVGDMGLILKGLRRAAKSNRRKNSRRNVAAGPAWNRAKARENRRRNGSRRRNTGKIVWGGSGGVIWGKIKGSHDVFTVERPFIGQKWVLKFYEDGRSPGTILASGHDVDALQRRGDKFYALHTGTGTRKNSRRNASVTWGDSVNILGGVLSGSRGVVTEPMTGGWNVHLTFVPPNARKYGWVGETKRIQAKFLEKAGKRKNRRRNGEDYLIRDLGDNTVQVLLANGNWSGPMNAASSTFDFPDDGEWDPKTKQTVPLHPELVALLRAERERPRFNTRRRNTRNPGPDPRGRGWTKRGNRWLWANGTSGVSFMVLEKQGPGVLIYKLQALTDHGMYKHTKPSQWTTPNKAFAAAAKWFPALTGATVGSDLTQHWSKMNRKNRRNGDDYL